MGKMLTSRRKITYIKVNNVNKIIHIVVKGNNLSKTFYFAFFAYFKCGEIISAIILRMHSEKLSFLDSHHAIYNQLLTVTVKNLIHLFY